MELNEANKYNQKLYKDGKLCSSCKYFNTTKQKCDKFDGLTVHEDFTCNLWASNEYSNV